MTKKQILRILCFLVLAFTLTVALSGLFEFDNSHMSQRLKTYKDFDKGTVDAVYIGSSAVDRYWIPAKAFEDYGMTVYPISTDGQPVWLVKNMIKEALKGQSPKLFIIDIRSFVWNVGEEISLADTRSRRVIDELPFFSFNRLSAINRTQKALYDLSRANETKDDETSRFDISFYFSFIRYHGKWSEEGFSFDELTNPPSKTLGFYLTKTNSPTRKKLDFPELTDEVGELDESNTYYLYELLDYIKTLDAKFLFVDTQRSFKNSSAMRTNAVKQIVMKEGFECKFYNESAMWKELPLDTETDFYDKSHVNFRGAVKFTDHFAKFLSENYDLPDHREDEKCQDWFGVYDEIVKTVEKWEKDKK